MPSGARAGRAGRGRHLDEDDQARVEAAVITRDTLNEVLEEMRADSPHKLTS